MSSLVFRAGIRAGRSYVVSQVAAWFGRLGNCLQNKWLAHVGIVRSKGGPERASEIG
jgi:hypothetical protein